MSLPFIAVDLNKPLSVTIKSQVNMPWELVEYV